MKALNKILTLGLLSVFGTAAVSCVEQEQNPDDVKKITLEVDVEEIVADGISTATFTVKSDQDKDITSSCVITCSNNNTEVKDGKFSTAEQGLYTFSASYGKLKSNVVKLAAKPVASGPVQPQGENKWVTTDCKTPIKYAEGRFFGSARSTGIEVTGTGTNYLTFICTPGEKVKSYRVMVYPLSWIYNQLVNQLNMENKEELTVDDADYVVKSFMTNMNYEVLAGKLMNGTPASLGDAFPEYEFSWHTMDIEQAWQLHPGADYLLVTLSSFDEECTDAESYADMAICHFQIPEGELAGNPQVKIDPNPSYSSYSVTYSANEDAKYMYFLSIDSAQVDQYIGLYGETMYRDFLRHYGSMVDISVEPYVSNTTPTEILPDVTYSATAIALDANGNPAKAINRVDFKLMEKPTEDKRVIGTASIINTITASSVVKFDVEMDKHTKYVYQSFYPVNQANSYMQAADAVKEDLIWKLADEGWAHQNMNFKWDKENGTPVGESYISKDEYWMDLLPGTEYALLYVTQNGYGDLSELQMSPVFKTKTIIRDQPDMCDANFSFKLVALSPTTMRYEFEFDPEKVAMYYFGCYSNIAERFINTSDVYDYPHKNSDRDTWMFWMLDYRDPQYQLPFPDGWSTVGMNDGKDSMVLAGLDPDTIYSYACVYETWDGYISGLYFAEESTTPLNFGPNPSLDTEGKANEDGSYEFTFMGNTDVGGIQTITATPTHELASALQLAILRDPALKNKLTEEKYVNYARKQLVDLGISHLGDSSVLKVDARELEEQDLYVVLAVGEGEKDGNPTYSNVAYYVWTKETNSFQTLSDYLNN